MEKTLFLTLAASLLMPLTAIHAAESLEQQFQNPPEEAKPSFGPEIRLKPVLPRVFGSKMILQRDREVPVWGWAEPGEEVAVSFAGQVKKTKADAHGKWIVKLAPMPASAESRTMVVKGNNEVRFDDVLVGEVWLASGQSNMYWTWGDILPEQHIPAKGLPGVDWESCMTLNTTWGYNEHDHAWKSSQVIIRNLVDIASKGGNYLLNIGPKGDGTIPKETVDAFSALGKWMDVNSESIRGTTASPVEKYSFDGRITTKGKVHYLSVFKRPDKGVITVPIVAKKATLLAGGQSLAVTAGPSETSIELPAELPDPVATVIRLE